MFGVWSFSHTERRAIRMRAISVHVNPIARLVYAAGAIPEPFIERQDCTPRRLTVCSLYAKCASISAPLSCLGSCRRCSKMVGVEEIMS